MVKKVNQTNSSNQQKSQNFLTKIKIKLTITYSKEKDGGYYYSKLIKKDQRSDKSASIYNNI